jgi:hypothetical protein
MSGSNADSTAAPRRPTGTSTRSGRLASLGSPVVSGTGDLPNGERLPVSLPDNEPGSVLEIGLIDRSDEVVR